MAAQAESRPDLAIGEAFCEIVDHLQFAWREQIQPARVDRANCGRRGKSLQREPYFAAVSPNLPLMYHANALAECFQRLVLAENATGAGTESIEYDLALGRIHQYDRRNCRMDFVKLA